MRLKLENVNTINRKLANGQTRTYYYHRITGKRIDAKPNTLAFAHAYEEASKHHENSTDNFASLLRAYQASADFRALADSTKMNYRHRISVLNDIFGDFALTTICNKRFKTDVLAWRDDLSAETPSAAESLVKLLKAILSFSEQRGLIENNYLRGMPKLPQRNRSDCIWEHDQIKAILAVSPNVLQWAIKLALLTGQRRGDLIALRWTDIKPGFIRLIQGKTKAKVGIPVIPQLESLFSEIPRTAPTVLTTTFGKPWGDGSSLAWQWRKGLEKAGMDDKGLTFHDLRGTAVTALADVGCTEIQIAAITGHSLEHISKILKTYLKRTDAQAVGAMAKLGTSWIGELQNA